MSRIPRITGAELVRALGHSSFQVLRVRGSHHMPRHLDGRGTVVPVHAADTVGPLVSAPVQKQQRDW